MVFSSITFLFYFLPAALLIYFAAPRAWRNLVMFLLGLVFYTWGAGEFVLVLLASILANWGLAWLTEAAHRRQHLKAGRTILTVAIVGNLLLLGYFKYTHFLLEQVNALRQWLRPDAAPLPIPNILLPIGISFITFQAISYLVDVAQNRARALRNPIDYGMYIAMFPHSIAGPIVRYHQIEAQIPPERRRMDWDALFSGLVRFSLGLVKKVVIADSISQLVDPAFAASSLSAPAAWIGVLGFTLQVYFDFSGYSDMAIGLARMFGFTFPENFNRPLASVSITDFWRRWHITLSEWFRDYVFIPLGGSRTAPWKVYRNLFTVFLLVGVWHGANWTFVVFGALQGTIMSLERLTGRRFAGDFRHPILQRAVNQVVLLLCMVLFRSPNLASAWAYYRSLFGVPAAPPVPFWPGLPRESLAALALASLTLFWPDTFVTGKFLDGSDRRAAGWLRLALATVGMAAAVSLVLSRNFLAFIYFQF